ncbi:MAG: RNA 2'-phosphotransferase [Thermodesulfobacteriota bacterium]|nr:RNA 2'-phosphotransferase [Thermodesulfobacteriota bacterium]
MGQDHRTKNLRKLMSYILRHRPDEFGLVLDEEGFISIKELHRAIIEEEGWSYVRAGDILHVVHTSDKERFQINGKRIRAAYGHSFPMNIKYEPCVPPKILYHGTRLKTYPSILQNGLRPMGRQYVHLTTLQELALRIGHRRTTEPILLTINSKRANEEGIVFFRANELIYLVEALPVAYINVPPLPKRSKKKEVKKKKETEPEVLEHILFATRLHPHKHSKENKRKRVSNKKEWRKHKVPYKKYC